MGFIAVVGFCAMASAGATAPQPPYECIYAERTDAVYETTESCGEAAVELATDPRMQDAGLAAVSLMTGKAQRGVVWYTWCHTEDELEDFYKGLGVTRPAPNGVPA